MPEVVEELPAGYSVVGGSTPAAPPPPVVDSLPEGYTVAEEPGLMDRLSGLLAKPGEWVRGAIGLTPEKIEEITSIGAAGAKGTLTPYLGEQGAHLAAGAVKSLGDIGLVEGTNPVNLIPWGRIVGGGNMLRKLNMAFTALSAAGAAEQANPLAEEIGRAYKEGRLTPELVDKAIAFAVPATLAGVGAAAHVAGRGPKAPVEPPPGPSAAVRAAISPEDAAILERITAAKARGLEGVPAEVPPDPTLPPPKTRPARVKGREYTAVDDEVARILQESQPAPEAPPPPPSAVRDPAVAAELASPRQVAAEDVPARPGAVEEPAPTTPSPAAALDAAPVNPAAGPEAGALVLPTGAEARAIGAKAPEAIDKAIGTVASATKAIPFGGDASVLLNQNLKLGVIDPKGFVDAALLLPRAAVSPQAVARLRQTLDATDTRLGGLMKKSGLDLAVTDDVADALRSDWLKKIPGLKQYLGASDRAYTAPLASLRASTFLKLVGPHLEAGKTFASHPQLFKGYAELVNVLSGRGDLGRLKGAAGLLNAVFISPRNMAAKFQQFTMLGRRDIPVPVKLDLLKTHAKFYSGYAALLTMAKMAGYAVETEDPASPDFGKIRDGKVRIDLGTGDLALFRALSILKEGKRTLLSGEKRRETPGQTAGNFLQNKLAPLSGAIVRWSEARTEAEKEKAFWKLVGDMRPLWAGQDIQELAAQDTSQETKILFGATSFAGGRMNIYDEPASLTPEDKEFVRREEAAQDEAREIRARTDVPEAEDKPRKEQAESAERGLKRAQYIEGVMEALRRGDKPAAYRLKIKARVEDIDIDIEELAKRLARQPQTTDLRGELLRSGRP